MASKEDKSQSKTIKHYSISNFATRKDAVNLETPAMLDQSQKPEKSVTQISNPKTRQKPNLYGAETKKNESITKKHLNSHSYEKTLLIARWRLEQKTEG
jgi:hypothetical protein